MTYIKNVWNDEILEGEERFTIKRDDDSTIVDGAKIELKNNIIVAGTPVDAERMNHIEQGISEAHVALDIATGIKILGYFVDATILEASVINRAAGDAYGVGNAAPYDVYIWDGVNQTWVNIGNAIGPVGPEGPRGLKGDQGEKGEQGEKGDKGDAATVTVGTTTTGEPGTEANVINTGTANDAILDFAIPRGEKGEKGDKGDKGDIGEQGHGLVIKGFFNDIASLQASIQDPVDGDAYGIGEEAPYEIYIWDSIHLEWANYGPIKGDKGDTGDDGHSLLYDWDGTRLGIKLDNESSYTYTDLKGDKGDKGDTGDDGHSLLYDWDGTRLGIKLDNESSYTYTDLKGDDGGLDYTNMTLDTSPVDADVVPVNGTRNGTLSQLKISLSNIKSYILGTLFNTSSGHDHDGTNSKKIAASNVDGLADYFDASTGHDHNGTNSKKIAYENLTGTPTFETSASNIKADGIASVGSLSTIARADHVHPQELISVANGGTGRSTLTVDNVLIGDGSNQVKLIPVSEFQSGGADPMEIFYFGGF